VVGSLYLARGGLLPGYEVYSVYDWGAGLRQGQPVMLSGVSVGYVGDVDIRRDGKLVVQMRIYDKYRVPHGTTSRVAPNGVFGDMMVTLHPSKATDDYFAAGDTVPAGPPSVGVADILGKVDSISRDVQLLTTALRRSLVDEQGLNDIRRTIGSPRRRADAVDSAQVDSTLRAVGDAAGRLATLTTELQGTTALLNGVLQKVESGEGSAAKLVNDAGLYTDVRALVQRLDSLTADFQKNPKKYINVKVF